MDELIACAARISLRLKARKETVAVAESYALIRARLVRDRFGAAWGIGETGAAGPTGNRYGDPAGHTCISLSGPKEASLALRTGAADRLSNMHAFSAAALELFEKTLSS